MGYFQAPTKQIATGRSVYRPSASLGGLVHRGLKGLGVIEALVGTRSVMQYVLIGRYLASGVSSTCRVTVGALDVC